MESRAQAERAQGPQENGGFGRDACRNRRHLIACSSNEVSAGTSRAPRYRKLYRKCWALVVVALPSGTWFATVATCRPGAGRSFGRRAGFIGRNQPGAVPSAFSQPRPRMGQSLKKPVRHGLDVAKSAGWTRINHRCCVLQIAVIKHDTFKNNKWNKISFSYCRLHPPTSISLSKDHLFGLRVRGR